MSRLDGIPRNLLRTALYGSDEWGNRIGPGSDRCIKVRDRLGRGYTTAHTGSLAAEARLDPFLQERIAAKLSGRQLQALNLDDRGYTDSQIAEAMGCSLFTAKGHLRDARRRLVELAAAVRR